MGFNKQSKEIIFNIDDESVKKAILFFDKKSLKEKIILNFYNLSINYLLFFKNYIYILN